VLIVAIFYGETLVVFQAGFLCIVGSKFH
jgi:hypothetical protein